MRTRRLVMAAGVFVAVVAADEVAGVAVRASMALKAPRPSLPWVPWVPWVLWVL